MTDTAIEGLDHGIIGVRDLEAARKLFERLGFTLSRRGRHIGWGTANYCIMFGPDYLEILGIVDPAQFDAGLGDFLDKREGLLKVAGRSRDITVTAGHFEAQGFAPKPVQDLARLLEMPEGDVKPAFKLVHLPEDKTPGMSTFFCQHLTPEMVWRPEWMTHANGAKAVHAYTILHHDPESLADCYGRLFGRDPCVRENRLIVETGGGKLVFVHPDRIRDLHPGLVWNAAVEDGTMISVTIAVEETGRTVKVFEENGINFCRRTDGSILVQPDAAMGVALNFQAL